MASSQSQGCCTAVEVWGFGEENESMCTYSYCSAILQKEITSWRKLGHAMIIVHSTLGQKDLNKALRELGFKRTKFYAKEKCPRTRVAMWHLPLFPEGIE